MLLAERYPTLGPPHDGMPSGAIDYANVNGLAGSIELYLGKDVPTGPDGRLYPVQCKSFSPALSAYQGEITEKAVIQEAFRRKCKLAAAQPHLVPGQDWSGMRLVIDTIRKAAQAAFDDRPPILRVMTDV